MRLKVVFSSIILVVVSFLLGWDFGSKLTKQRLQELGFAAQYRAPAVTTSTPSVVSEKPKTVSLMLDYGDGTVKTFTDIQLKENETLFDVTKKIVEANNIAFAYDPPGQYGIFVKAIAGLTGGTDGKYWTYWVNNKMGEVAADQYKLKAGDAAEWKFVKLKM